MSTAWNATPYVRHHVGDLTDDAGNLRLHGQKVEVRWVYQRDNFVAQNDDVHFSGLAYDREGTFYGITGREGGGGNVGSKVEILRGKDALTWFAKHAVWDKAFARELCRAIDQPAFKLRPLVRRARCG